MTHDDGAEHTIFSKCQKVNDKYIANIFATILINTFDDIFRLDDYPEISIERKKRPQNPKRKI